MALKVFRLDYDPRRMHREVSVLRRLDCPHIVRLLRVDDISLRGASYSLVTYEYLSGGDLRQFLTPDAPPVPVDSLVRIGMQIGCGIECMWKQRCVHRDVKPANIIRASDERYVLVDVALAMHLDLARITASGLVPGTPGYQSPEQARGRRNLTVHSDIFSFGVTLYEIATRQHPFGGVQQMIGQQEPRAIESIRRDLPRSFVRLVIRMLAYVPAERPANVCDRFQQLAELK